MIIAALLLQATAVASPTCTNVAVSHIAEASAPSILHVFQNGEPVPLRLIWIGPDGKPIDQVLIAPGAYNSVQTYVGHVFRLVDPAGQCRREVRIADGPTGTFAGASHYRPVAVRSGWHLFVDQALDPATHPAQDAITIVGRMLAEVDSVLPSMSLRALRGTPIFLHANANPRAMFHRDPAWLIANGRTAEMVNGIELSNASIFIQEARVQPGTILHELAHAHYARLPDQDRAEVEAVYQRMMESGRYRSIKRHDGSVIDAYARSNAAEYFAELSEAYFSRNDFFPFTRAELTRYDPEGARLIAALWR